MRLIQASAPSAGQIVAAACVLAMLYFGRGVLAPLALAGVLSLVIAPLKRKLARLGLGHTAGALASVLLVATCIGWVGVVLTSQLVAVASDMPQYKETVRAKLEQVRDLTIRPLERMEAELSGVVPRAPLGPAVKPPVRSGKALAEPQPAPAPPVAEARPRATDTLSRVLSSMWGPVGQAGIVLVLLVFILLEHEGLRDRMIRLAGEAEAGRTMQAVEDAAQGISRFFFSQFVVNVTFGVVLGFVLWIVGIPHAALWGAIGALARFVPYIGALAAGAAIAGFAAAVDPGWALMFWSLALFVLLEVVVAHWVEPRVYGHSSGLAPLGVIVSALFWGALWGPVGLLLSTPMTLCLVVAGRHVRALEPISILLGEPPGLTAGLRVYQRALSGEPGEIVTAARTYLARSNFARYCDQILLPGLALAAADFRSGRIGGEQQDRIRITIASVAQSLGTARPQEGASRRRRSTSLLDADVGAHLHALRRQRLGRWRGLAETVGRPVVWCVDLGSVREDVLSALLVQALRDEGVHASGVALDAACVPREAVDADADSVSTVFLAYPLAEHQAAWQEAAASLRASLPQAMLLTIQLPLEDVTDDHARIAAQVDLVVGSFSEAVAFVLAGRTTPA
jgi:predicted PurR-regulated permease PerM